MKRYLSGFLLTMLVGCGGTPFDGIADSTVVDAGQEATEVDAGARPPDARADMLAEADAPTTVEATIPEASADGAGEASVDAATGIGEGGPGDSWPSDVTLEPYCTDDEIYPRLSHTCQEWIRTTPYPNFTGCCLSDHTCGRVVNEVPPHCDRLPR